MVIKNVVTAAVIVFSMFVFTAQAAVPVSGRIIESTAETPLEYANVLLLSLPDSAFVDGTTSSKDGLFRFDSVDSGMYLLKVSFVGYENRFVPVDISAGAVDLADIRLTESNVLGEVLVSAKIPTFCTGVNGGIVANVSTTLLSSVGTANDVLQRMPGVVAGNGKITVFGKGAPLVYINNRKVRDMQELERLESSEISTVELITAPGATYDAEGRAVLLIKTKSRMGGFSAQATERFRQGRYLGNNENLSISYAREKLNLFATYLHNYNKQEATEDHYAILKNADCVWQHRMYLPGYHFSDNSQQVSAGLDYSLNGKHALGGQYQFYTGKDNDITLINTTTHLNGVLHETSQSKALTKDYDYQHLANAFYNGDFSERFSLRFDFDYLRNHDDRNQRSNEIVNSAQTNVVEIFNQTDYDLYAGKLTGSWKSGIGIVGFGGEYNNITGSGFVRSSGISNNTEFTNTEQKAAAFASYSHKIADINIAAGLRYEFTSEQYTEDVLRTVIIDRTYGDWYPNISISKPLKNVDLSLTFNKRTQRPGFSQLNGNVVYINRFVFQRGDPYLNKTNIYDANFQARVKMFYLNLGYAYLKNIVLPFFKEQGDNTNAILSTYANFPKCEELNATLNFNHKIAFWQPNYTAGLSKPFFSANYDGQEIAYNRVNYFFRAYNDFTLPFGVVLSCNLRYQSDAQETFYEVESWQQIDAGFRKSFFDNTLRLNFMVYDIFDWVKQENHIRINNIYWDMHKKY
ncbi:MAG: outer membrane beta-barrel protein, partial [Tannerella sp.]|nr:outer membrane beta-barrel protein [Tannerella sp.]